MVVRLLTVLALLVIAGAGIAFVLYGRARMKEQEQKEKLFLQIHYGLLFVLLLPGIVFMFFMVKQKPEP